MKISIARTRIRSVTAFAGLPIACAVATAQSLDTVEYRVVWEGGDSLPVPGGTSTSVNLKSASDSNYWPIMSEDGSLFFSGSYAGETHIWRALPNGSISRVASSGETIETVLGTSREISVFSWATGPATTSREGHFAIGIEADDNDTGNRLGVGATSTLDGSFKIVMSAEIEGVNTFGFVIDAFQDFLAMGPDGDLVAHGALPANARYWARSAPGPMAMTETTAINVAPAYTSIFCATGLSVVTQEPTLNADGDIGFGGASNDSCADSSWGIIDFSTGSYDELFEISDESLLLAEFSTSVSDRPAGLLSPRAVLARPVPQEIREYDPATDSVSFLAEAGEPLPGLGLDFQGAESDFAIIARGDFVMNAFVDDSGVEPRIVVRRAGASFVGFAEPGSARPDGGGYWADNVDAVDLLTSGEFSLVEINIPPLRDGRFADLIFVSRIDDRLVKVYEPGDIVTADIGGSLVQIKFKNNSSAATDFKLNSAEDGRGRSFVGVPDSGAPGGVSRQIVFETTITDSAGMDERDAVVVATISPQYGDIAAPFGSCTSADLTQYTIWYSAGDLRADLAAPYGVLTFADFTAFNAAYSACP